MARSSAQRKEDPQATTKKASPAARAQEILGEGPKDNKYLPEGFRRHSAVMHRDHLYKLKCLAFWENIPIYEAQYMIFEDYFNRVKIKDMPPRKSILPR